MAWAPFSATRKAMLGRAIGRSEERPSFDELLARWPEAGRRGETFQYLTTI
jgi:hypothetical protein